MNKLLLSLGLVASVALVGCTANELAALATGKALVSGKVYAPADQTAAIAAGGYNYRTVQARSDEKGVNAAKVTFAKLDGGASAATAQTDTTGSFSAELDAGSYTVTATFKGKDNQDVTLSGLVAAAGPTSFELDVAHNLVASKLLTGGVKAIDAAKLQEAVAGLQNDLSKVAKAPMPVSRTEAAAAFDANASADTKAKVDALLK